MAAPAFPGGESVKGVHWVEPRLRCQVSFQERTPPGPFPGPGLREAAAVKKLYDQREISRLLGISEGQVRSWDRQGLIPHLEKSRGALWFDFQGLVAFRTVRELRRQGVSLGRIRKCVDRLRQMLPGLKQPLAEVRIYIQRGRLILGKTG